MNNTRAETNGVLPPELLGSPPRPVALKAGGWALLLLAVMIAGSALAVTAAFVIAQGLLNERRREIEVDGATAIATVLRIERSRGENKRRVVTYGYQAEGRGWIGRARLQERDRRPLENGQHIEVRYLRSRPQESWLPGYEPSLPPTWLVPLLWLGAIAASLAILWSLRREWNLLAGGRPAMARVLHTEPVQRGKRKVHRVRYQYRTLSGAVREGHFDLAKDPPAEGSWIPIVYDPEQTERSVRYPFALVRVRR